MSKISPRNLIIGASGFIGSSLVKKLLARDSYIVAVIGENGLRYLTDFKDNGLTIYTYKEVKNNFKKLGKFKFLFNLSGYTDIRESFKEPLKYAMNKPITTIKLIENCRTEKFINISTASVYDFSYNPVSENSSLKPISPYAISQLSSDYYTEVLCNHYKTPYLILRLFNPYGPPNTEKGIIATIINELLEAKEVVLYNPERKFDFTFIEDVIEAIIFCTTREKGVINIGCGKEISLLEAYKKISFLLNNKFKKPRIVRSDNFKEEVFSNNNKLKKIGFKLRYDIDHGLRQTIDYFKEKRDSQ